MIHRVKLALIGIAALPLIATLGCSVGGEGYHDHYGRGYDYDHAREAGYYDNSTRAYDRSTGLTPSQYRAQTYNRGGQEGLAPENYGTTHEDRVQNHVAHENHMDREYGD